MRYKSFEACLNAITRLGWDDAVPEYDPRTDSFYIYRTSYTPVYGEDKDK